MSASIHFSPSFSLALPSFPSASLSLLSVFPKIRFKGVLILLAAKREKKKKKSGTGWSSRLVKALLDGKKKEREERRKSLSLLPFNVIRPDFTLSQFSLIEERR